jgi:magnesium and cobalt transporter
MFMQLLNKLFRSRIETKSELLALIKDAAGNKVIDADTLPIVEAVLQIEELRAKDIMLPRHQMDTIDIDDDIDTICSKIEKTGHSRFPVIEDEVSNIIGVLHSKDLVRYLVKQEKFNLRDHLRQAYFVPEIKRLDGLMYEMRVRQTHLAVVVDEFTNVVGMVTLEMIVEQIIGEIEDEHDLIGSERDLFDLGNGNYRIKGHCQLSQVNAKLDLNWQDDKVETIGGFLVKYLGRIPSSGEIINLAPFQIEIISADSRKIKSLMFRK